MCPRKSTPKPPDLGRYRAKRSAERSPEPFGGEGVAHPGLFVIQKHAARRTHYDLRLEVGGVLKSWAVPKGPSLDPKEKRLAVETEDHPVEYADFEGVIPKGNYGAGAMIVWDRGTWIPLEDFDEGYSRGKLLFELRGHKLRGVWTLFRTAKSAARRSRDRGDGREWLLMKKPDAAARSGAEDSLPEASILSGLTVEELGEGSDRLAGIAEEASRLGAPRGAPDIGSVDLMLAEPRDAPFSRTGWLFELKYDGYRLLAGRQGERARLRYRNGHDATDIFPEITHALESLPVPSFLLDGEVVVLDDDARPNFQRLQKRALLSRPRDAELAAHEHPAVYYAFDLLAVGDYDLRPLPLVRRKELLRRLLPPAGPLRFSDHVEDRGEELFDRIESLGLEGMVAKDSSSPYVGRRSSLWIKIRLDRVGDFVVVGWAEPRRGRSGFASLHLATFEPDEEQRGELIYAGRVGTGFSDEQLADIRSALDELERPDPPCGGALPQGGKHHWVEPRLVCEVRYKERTEQGLLRHPVFLRLRTDKTMRDCAPQGEREAPPSQLEAAAPTAGGTDVRAPQLTNLDKIFWPADGTTKGELIDYYRTIAPAMLPYLADRPVVLTRYPDGIEGKSFFQKNAPEFAPDWIRTVTIWSEGSEREIDYFVCEDVESLVYLANLGTIPIHMWSSRLASLGRPDWCILDLDPKEAPFDHVVSVAREVHRICNEIELPSYVKTSGSSGLHILLPLGAACTYEQSRQLGQLIAQITVARLPQRATIARTLRRRQGKVYLDYLQNGHGRLLVAPFSVRPLPGAPVSTPLRWREVNRRLSPAKHTIRSVPRRLERLASDPLAGVLEDKPDLVAALGRLAELVAE